MITCGKSLVGEDLISEYEQNEGLEHRNAREVHGVSLKFQVFVDSVQKHKRMQRIAHCT